MTTTTVTLQSTILRLLSQPQVDKRLGRGKMYFAEAVLSEYPTGKQPSVQLIAQTLWLLLGRGFIYIDIWQPAPENWKWGLTDAGAASAKDEQFNPDDPELYMGRLRSNIPDLSDLVLSYADEALRCYAHGCYLASAVMLGVASEAAFMEMARASVTWLESAGPALKKVLDNPREQYVKKFEAFRRRVEPRKADLPNDLADGMNLTFNSVIELLRIGRNDSGHPTGKPMSREDQYIALQMAGRYLQRLYQFRAFFMGKPPRGQTTKSRGEASGQA